ncbi:MAG: MerR family transcriptional regulator [Anaerolineae bacterium]|jgi:DNA-binding transcriptional MerR regulator
MATPTEVSDRLDIPPATLRRYVSLFGDHLSEGARRQRGRQFDEADIETLSRVRELFAAGKSTEEVTAALGGKAPEPTVTTPPSQREPVLERRSSEPVAAPPAQAETEQPEEGADAPPGHRPRPRQFPRSEPVRSSLEVQKLAAKSFGATEGLSQKVALHEDRLSRTDERLLVLEYRLTRLEEWLKLPWYKRLFSRPPLYEL